MADDWNELSSFGIDVFHIENPIIKEDLQFSSSTGNDVFSYHSFIKHPIKSIFQIFYYRILYILGIRKWL
ncbi:hypothetical protein [Photobacterium leiognathi]|uniref:hypothetical protein n=1 Tax=Photobacterium leiognathi TaxID=553611 RepID=UPI00273A4CC7|nr:hypothetical protein [Photobacterium leiognathi]